jgi:hypothetical protein
MWREDGGTMGEEGATSVVAELVEDHVAMHGVRRFLRENPQVLVLLLICLILGIGTFLIVVFGIASSGPGHVTGEPSGSIGLGQGMSWIGA